MKRPLRYSKTAQKDRIDLSKERKGCEDSFEDEQPFKFCVKLRDMVKLTKSEH